MPGATDPPDFVGFGGDDVDERANLLDELSLLLLKSEWYARRVAVRRRFAKRREYLLLRRQQLVHRSLQRAAVGGRPKEDRHERPNPNSHEGFERAVCGKLKGMPRLRGTRHDDHGGDEGCDKPEVAVLALHSVGEVAKEGRRHDEHQPTVLRKQHQDEEPGEERDQGPDSAQHALVERLSMPRLPDHRDRDRGPGWAHPIGT